jgi:fluoroacetyl-CoA thioesterase
MEALQPHLGSRRERRFVVAREHTVPALPLASPSVAGMPEVLATPVLVGMVECACAEHLLDVAPEIGLSLGVVVEIEHTAATPVGFTVVLSTELVALEGRQVTFRFSAHDGIDAIGAGRHVRAVVPRARFEQRLAEKRARAG